MSGFVALRLDNIVNNRSRRVTPCGSGTAPESVWWGREGPFSDIRLLEIDAVTRRPAVHAVEMRS